MKNIFSKTTEKRTQNGLKTDSKRTNYGIPILIFAFLTLGFGQVWADSTVQGGYIYFDEYNSGYTGAGDMQFWIGHSKHSCAYSMTKITNTKLWYCQASGWGDATYFAFTSGCNDWGCADQKYYDRIGSNTWKSGIKESYTLNSGSYYVFKAASTANKAAVSSDSPYGHQGNAYSSLNKSQTIKVQVSTDGGNTYSNPATAPATISFSSKTFSNANTCGTSSTGSFTAGGSTVSLSRNAGFTATTELTYSSLSSGYTFVCWHDGSSSVGTETSYTYYPTGTNTITARFTKNFTVGDKIYLLRNTTWKNASGLNHYAAYFYGAEGNTWVNCERVGTSDYYSVTVPSGNWGYVVFVALNNASNSWDYKIYQTDDLMYDAAHNGVEITGSNKSQSWIFVYTDLSVSRNNSSYAAAPSITNSQTVVKSGSSITVNAGTETTGYHWVNWTSNKGSFGTATNKSTTFTPTANSAVATANYAINTQTVRFSGKGNTGGSMSNQVYTYGVAQALTSNAFTKTGYNFGGWATSSAEADTKTVAHTDGASITLNPATHGTYYDLYAIWNAKQCAINFDFDATDPGHGSHTSATTSTTATYAAAMLSVTPPTAADGWAFMGYFDAADGAGTQYYTSTGASARAWDKNTEDPTTLYAYYKKAEITNLSFDAAVVAPSTSVGVTPTVVPTPAGTNSICWKLLYSNGNLYEPQPTFVPNPGDVGNKVTFTAPSTSGMYLVAAVLRTGNECNGGTKLDSVTYPFQVAGDHDVTIQYKDASGNIIKASETVTGRPLAWSDNITAPTIFGYTFARWDAGDGVTIKNGDLDPVTTSTDATIKIKAIYDGRLTAVYNQKNIIYFKNTLGWSSVFVNLLAGSYWDKDQGTGNKNLDGARSNKQMTLVPGETDVYYYDYGSTTPSEYVSFLDRSLNNYSGFEGTEADPVRVCYPTIPNPNNAQTEMAYFGFYSKTPMFVPSKAYETATSGGDLWNHSKARYCNSGYWTKYTPGTGYYLRIYDPNDASRLIQKIEFTSEDDLIPMTATANLEANKTYQFEVSREDQQFYSNGGSMDYDDRYGQGVAWELFRPDTYAKTSFVTTADGDYIFHLTHSAENTGHVWRLRIAAEYPIADGDYRVVYKDGVHTKWHPSAVVPKVNNGKDTVSFFIRPNSSPSMKIQQATVDGETGAITWSAGTDISSSLTSLTKDSVYNICLQMNESGAISVENVEVYTGNFYIRTDAANSKWDNYRSDPDHLMTYSEYSITHGGYSHYYCHWVTIEDAARKNVKFCIANDYSPCISDTLTRETASGEWENINSFIDASGNLLRSANVRFMWNQHDNTIKRAYLDPAKNDDNFLVLESADSKIANESGVVQSSIVFSDNENWIYEANVKAKPNAQIRLKATWGDASPIVQYFKGTESTTETLITGSTDDWYDIRLIYDYKTNRLIAAMLPSGNHTSVEPINADVMFIREHQGDISQVTFTEDGALTDIKIAYGVMRFNKWTLNNKEKTGSHNPLASPASPYERAMYFISFPFEVKLSEVFGIGNYGQDWIVEYYDGAERARTGWWEGEPGFWRYVWNRKDFVLKPNVGYLLQLELASFGEASSAWDNDNEQIELFFPSSGNLGTITNTTVNCTIPEHACTINRHETEGLPDTPDNPHTSYNRTIFDSHWNVMSVPTYVNANNPSFANTTWIGGGEGNVGPKFLYTWNPDDNTLTATSGTGFMYHAMHAYMVQYGGNVQWVTSGTGPASIVARDTYAEQPKEVEFRIEIQQNEKMVDQTFVIMSNDDEINANFQFGEDMSKDFNARNANIYTMTADNVASAGNTLPMSETTTIVPVGVSVKKNGDYTFAIPEGTEGIGVTLVDNETGARTSLSALDYTVTLQAGDYTGRFVLEISPIQNTPTGLEEPTSDSSLKGRAQKVMIDGILYIVKDGKMFDARGARVQ